MDGGSMSGGAAADSGFDRNTSNVIGSVGAKMPFRPESFLSCESRQGAPMRVKVSGELRENEGGLVSP